MERCTVLRGECHDAGCYVDTPHACHDILCTTKRLREQLADAQATIAALQDTIIQMGGQAAVLAKDAMAAKEQIAALQAERDEYKTMYACLTGETYDNPIADLKAQLTQRTAELEAIKADTKNMLDVATSRLREQVNDLQAELGRVRGERDKLQSEVDGWELGSRGFP